MAIAGTLGKSLYKHFNESIEAMKFSLEVDLDDALTKSDAARELGRILRYWGGNLHHYELRPGDGSVVYDSGYQEVGRWEIAAGPSELS